MPAAENTDTLIDEREYPVPRELVFEVWTRAEHFARWFAPQNVEVARCEMDARPGGALRFEHRFATGEVVSIRGVFDEVVAPSRLSITFAFVDADGRPVAPPMVPDWPLGARIVMTVVLTATERGTRMAVHQRVAEPEHANHPAVLRHRNMAGEGWRQTVPRLVEYLEQRNGEWRS